MKEILNSIIPFYLGGMTTYLMLGIDAGDFTILFFLEAVMWPISFVETVIARCRREK